MILDVKLSEYARRCGVDWTTAKRWYVQGLIPGAYQPVPRGSIIVPDDVFDRQGAAKVEEPAGLTVVYARVSNASRRKTDLEYQADRIVRYCNANGWTVDRVIKEVGSGVNAERPKLTALLASDEPISRLVVEHRDRLTRFGFPYLERIAALRGMDLVVMNRAEDDTSDLMEDLSAILYSFMAKLYGRRRGNGKARLMLEEAGDDDRSAQA